MYQANEEERLAGFQFQTQKTFLHWTSRIKNKNKNKFKKKNTKKPDNKLENKMINSIYSSK